MATIQLSNNLGLAPPKAKPSIQPIDPPPPAAENPQANPQPASPSSLQTEFAFELPTGYLDATGQVHRQGVMRLARTIDEVEPMSDPRVQANPAYATVIILARVILALGALPDISPMVIEGLFAGDLNYLQNFYRKINGLVE
ncbi:hypothetical protein [Vasconcelosia minhoensis]|uniref:hypothetical protein n=1 Tax=Vasconcelosia minhoensis TaxID=3366354 RepID=UPI001D134501|nr:hypothetical protein [Romeria gracilis]